MHCVTQIPACVHVTIITVLPFLLSNQTFPPARAVTPPKDTPSQTLPPTPPHQIPFKHIHPQAMATDIMLRSVAHSFLNSMEYTV